MNRKERQKVYSLKLVNGDWNFNSLGSGSISQGSDLLCQLYALNLKTPLNSNVMEKGYGSTLNECIGSSTGKIQSTIREADMAQTQRMQDLYRNDRNLLENNQIPLSTNLIQTSETNYQVIVNTVGKPTSFNFEMN